MTYAITNTVSTFINSQLPEFIKEQDPNFSAFVQAYFEFLETANLGPNTNSVVYNAKNLLNYKDVDTTTDAFIQYFINDFLPYFPNDVALNERKLIKVARQFYQQKGTPQSIQFLFRVLYNKQADIYFPKNNILKLSDGKWTQPQALRLLLDVQHQSFDVQQLVQRIGIGSNSGAQCVIESVTKTVDPNLGFEVAEVYVSNITKPFDDLESLIINYGTDPSGNILIFEEKIIAALSSIKIDPKNRGLKYNKGDPVVLTGGLEPNDPQAQKGVAYVGNVTVGSVSSINVNFGGYNYRENPNTVVTFTNAPSDNTGKGAKAIVSSLDTGNTTYLLVNTDAIDYKANANIGDANYQFAAAVANSIAANANTPLQNALSFANLSFAPIKTMNIISQGGGYRAVPALSLEVIYYTDFLNDLITAAAGNQNLANTDITQYAQNIDDLGYFAHVSVLNGGRGYSNVTDSIVPQSAIGYDAKFGFTTDLNGSITSVSIINKGNAYFTIPPLIVANTANTANAPAGSNAVLLAYGYGQGANLSLGVNQIGQIIDIDLINRGFDYISAPIVSLRVQDIKINPLAVNQVIAGDTVVYQGSNTNTATYIAVVDSLNLTDNVLRVYNYHGTLNLYQPLVVTLITQNQINVTVNTAATANVVTYGNGQAKANAIFLNGLIDYPGFYLNTDGQPSSDQYIEDGITYHNYSYQIIVEKALAQYKNALLNIVHPAGMAMLGKFVIQASGGVSDRANSQIKYISPLIGNVTSNAFLSTGILSGYATNFQSLGVQNNDVIVFNTASSTRKLQAKVITNVNSDISLTLESNTMWILDGLCRVSNNSNLIYTTPGIFYGNVDISDKVLMNVNGNLILANVTAVDSGGNYVNTNINFSTTASNLVMAVYPNLINCTYQIVSANQV